MRWSCLLAATWLNLADAREIVPRTSASYSIPEETLDGGGGIASSTRYQSVSSFEPATMSDSVSTHYYLQHGYIVPQGPFDPYWHWIKRFYPSDNDPDLVAKQADPNHDGWKNLLGFALGASPIRFLPELLPTHTRDSDSLIVEYARSDQAGDYHLVIEYGSDVLGWNQAVHGESGVVIEVEDDGFGSDAFGAGIDRVRVHIPHSGQTNFFFRLGFTSG